MPSLAPLLFCNLLVARSRWNQIPLFVSVRPREGHDACSRVRFPSCLMGLWIYLKSTQPEVIAQHQSQCACACVYPKLIDTLLLLCTVKPTNKIQELWLLDVSFPQSPHDTPDLSRHRHCGVLLGDVWSFCFLIPAQPRDPSCCLPLGCRF